ncbi:carotenoid oxygenase family protein [Streptomyces orinoci]|uniref:Dioxygenase n=1 Tax=Streptomyces orinoci TaxID=67339 RepID=A0ABV3K1D0_STRON|nr:carotenoid oxygenase family protein [Streptomyces orinoci]
MTEDQSKTANPYLGGLFAPAREEITAMDLPVTGRVPDALRGRYLRNGPNPLRVDDPAGHLWFSGEGMVHGVRLRDGRAAWYRNRWVRSDEVARQLGEKVLHGPRHLGMDFAPNTHVQEFAGHLLALVEGGSLPYELDPDLYTVGPFDFHGTLPGGLAAHTVIDPRSGELHTVAYCPAWSYVQYLVAATDGRVRRCVEIPVEGRPMMHDFSLTEHHVLLYDLPVAFAAGWGSPPAFRWDPRRPARLGLLPREGGAGRVRWLEIEPCYVFHAMNAHERDGLITVHLVRYDRFFDLTRPAPFRQPAYLERWTVATADGTVRRLELDERPVEFPRVDPRRLTLPHRFGYAVHQPAGEERTGFGTGLLKYDLERGTAEEFPVPPGGDIGEGVFVPAGPGAAEDEGWVLAFAYDPRRAATDLLVLAAQDFTAGPVARIHLPVRVPVGAHGNWIPDQPPGP